MEEQKKHKGEKSNFLNYAIIALVAIVLTLGVVWVVNSMKDGSQGSSTNTKTGVSTDGNYFKGEANAPVTIIEFSDFQCPFCAKFWSETLSLLEQEYIQTGKVKLVYKHFPLSFHPMAMPAALASECAGEQGKFWEYHDMIFENQKLLSDSNLKQWASDLGLDTSQFNDCLDSEKYKSNVLADYQEGQAAGITGTPGFLINGQKVSGAQPFSIFQQAIEAELA